MKEYRIAVLPGDGVGREVIREGLKVLLVVARRFGHRFRLDRYAVGGEAIDVCGDPVEDSVVDACKSSAAVLFGAVGGPKWDSAPLGQTPQSGLQRLRTELDVYANLRPIRPYPSMAEVSPIKESVLAAGVDILIVRELTAGLYFGQPRFRENLEDGTSHAVDTLEYSTEKIERVAHVAFRMARQRHLRVTSVDKSNVLETSRLWRETVDRVGTGYADVEVQHLLADVAAMRLMSNPCDFDVILAPNMFGDILSDEAAVLAGSLGMLPSASLGDSPPGLFEPVHGSAPDIAGKGTANPVGAILSAALLLRHGLGLAEEAEAVEHAVERVIESGCRTADIACREKKPVSTSEMGAAILAELERKTEQRA